MKTAEEILKETLLKFCPEKERQYFEEDWNDADGSNQDVKKAMLEAMQEYANLKSSEYQERVKELEDQLNLVPTRKHQVISEIIDLRKGINEAHNKAVQDCISMVAYLNSLTERRSYKLTISELEKLKKQ